MNPKLFGGVMSHGAVMDPEFGYGERISVQSYITDVSTPGGGDAINGLLPFLTSGGSLSTQAFSGFGVGGTNFTGIDLNPSYFLQSRLGTYATLYNRYRWRRVKSTYFTGAQTGLTGSFSQGISTDPIVFPEGNGLTGPLLEPSYQAINNHNSTTTGPVWDNFSTDYKYTGGKAWYCRDPQDIQGQPTIGGEDTAADLRSIIQCRLMGLLKFIVTTTARSYGFVELAGILEFFDPVNTTATAAVTPIDLTPPFDEKRHAMLKHKSGHPTIVKRGRVIPLGDNRPPLFNPKIFNPKACNLHVRPRDTRVPIVDHDFDVKSTRSEDSLRERDPELLSVRHRDLPTLRGVLKAEQTSTPMSWEET